VDFDEGHLHLGVCQRHREAFQEDQNPYDSPDDCNYARQRTAEETVEPRIVATLQTPWQWLVRIEQDETRRMATATERRRQEERAKIRDLRRFLKQEGRFIQIVRTVRRLPEGQERMEGLRVFWQDVYDDPLTQALAEYLNLGDQRLGEDIHMLDEERAEDHRELFVIGPHEGGAVCFQARWSAGVSLLQEYVISRPSKSLAMSKD
jgi:hypothetical protein